MIRGFCDNCLYSSKSKNSNNIIFDKDKESNCESDKKITGNKSLKVFSEDLVNHNENVSENLSISKTIPDNLIVCSFCGEIFNHNKELIDHLELINNCPNCNEKYCNMIEFKNHLASHDKNKSKGHEESSAGSEEPSKKDVDSTVKDGIRPKRIVKSISKHDKTNENGLNNSPSIKPRRSSTVNDDTVDIRRSKRRSSVINYKTLMGTEGNIDNSHSLTDQTKNKNVIKEKSNIRTRSSMMSIKVEKLEIEPEKIPKEVQKNNSNYSLCKYDYFCNLCKSSYDDLNLLKLHIQSDEYINEIINVIGISISCKLCNSNFSSINDIKLHLNKEDHIMKYHIKKSDLSIYNCSLCDKSFINEADFKTHTALEKHCNIDNHLSDDKKLIETNNKDTFSIKTEPSDKIDENTKCYVCNHTFCNVYTLKRHLKTNKTCRASDQIKHLDEIKVVIHDINKEKLNYSHLEKSMSKNNTFDCKACKKSYDRYSKLKHHRTITGHEIQNNSGFFSCSSCDMSFKSLKSLRIHATQLRHKISTKHVNYKEETHNPSNLTNEDSDVKRFTCITCNLSFNKESSLKKHGTAMNHFIGVVKKEKCDFICKFCGADFSTKADLVFHLVCENHYSSYPVKLRCKYCHKVFSSLFNFLRHCQGQIHVGLYVAESYNNGFCELCDVKFNCVEDFKKHVVTKSHLAICVRSLISHPQSNVKRNKKLISPKEKSTKFACLKGCKDRFHKTQKLLDIHYEVVHNNQRGNVRCHICKKEFSYRGGLGNHLRYCTGNRYAVLKKGCYLCGKKFSMHSLLKAHLKHVHNITS